MTRSMDFFREPSNRQLFRERFEKDLQFFQLFFLLVNRSCPIKKIDLVWAENGPVRRVGIPRLMGTADALKSPSFGLLHGKDAAMPDPVFCNIVNDCGRRFARSCAISDEAAERRVRKTGRPQVYTCHAGLIDIAVPVRCGREHIATLLTGQVLREPPSEEGFARIRRSLGNYDYIDFRKLKAAYQQVPVVSSEDIQSTIEILEVFAEYLATSWKRLIDAIEQERQKAHEAQLHRKELAHLLLAGSAADRPAVRELMRLLGLIRSPNRAIVVKLESEEEYLGRKSPYDVAFTEALHAVEGVCGRVKDCLYTYLRRRGACIFLYDGEDGDLQENDLRARDLARRILNAIASCCDLRARVGIGERKTRWEEMSESYQEACLALAASRETPIATVKEPTAWTRELGETVGALCRLLSERRFAEVKESLAGLPVLLTRHFGKGPHSAGHRFCYASALDSMILTAERLGCTTDALNQLRGRLLWGMGQDESPCGPQAAFQEAAEQVVAEVKGLYVGRHQAIVRRACRILDRHLSSALTANSISLAAVAEEIGVSAGHLSRTFRHVMGRTMERYLMERRVELAKRLLLEPLNSVSDVADRCGFSDPAYFARVFRKIAGCTPSQYARDPLHAGPVPARCTLAPASSGRVA